MAEFKIDKSLSDEVSSLRKKANKINEDYEVIKSDKVNTLKTSMEYISQHAEIKELLELYKSLLLKDAKDLDDMIAEVGEMDTQIADAQSTGGNGSFGGGGGGIRGSGGGSRNESHGGGGGSSIGGGGGGR